MKINTDRSRTVRTVVLIDGNYYVDAFIQGVYSTTDKESDYRALQGSAKHVIDDESGDIDIVYDIASKVDSLTLEIKADLTKMIDNLQDNKSLVITHLKTNLALIEK